MEILTFMIGRIEPPPTVAILQASVIKHGTANWALIQSNVPLIAPDILAAITSLVVSCVPLACALEIVCSTPSCPPNPARGIVASIYSTAPVTTEHQKSQCPVGSVTVSGFSST